MIVGLWKWFVEDFAELSLTNPSFGGIALKYLEHADQFLSFVVQDQLFDLFVAALKGLSCILWLLIMESHSLILFLKTVQNLGNIKEDYILTEVVG